MRYTKGWLFCALGVWGLASFARGGDLAPPKASPAALVSQALESEVTGPSPARAELLQAALAQDTNFAPARWHSGQVRYQGQWLSIDEVARRAAADPQLKTYRTRRDAMIDTADEHASLARWCAKHKLPELARVHWTKVLEFEPENATAIAALDLQQSNGRLATREQLDAERKHAAQLRSASKRWQPQFLKWRAALERDDSKAREIALKKFAEVSEPAAIPALESTLVVKGTAPKAIELHTLFVRTLGQMRHADATAALLRMAVLTDTPEVRNAACEELKKRPLHTYVPQLIASLPGALQSKFQINILPSGTVIYEHQVCVEGRQANFVFTVESTVQAADAGTMPMLGQALNQDAQNAVAVERRMQDAAARADRDRQRIERVLEQTTGFTKAGDPGLWEKQYNEYTATYAPEVVKPVVYQTSTDTRGYATPTASTTTSGTRSGGAASAVSRAECFPAGTVVTTVLGRAPIERLKVGDLVLAQQTTTGELAYRPVQNTTLRPATPLVTIGLDGSSVRATRGHPFWVADLGWTMARHLKPGMVLHGLDGARVVQSVEESPAEPAYNLTISGYNTYFVGDSQLLVHDNLPSAETSVRLPGLAAVAK